MEGIEEKGDFNSYLILCNGVIGVPISFLTKYNPDQFEILGLMNSGEANEGIRYKNTKHGRPVVNGKELYIRILIKRKIND